MAALYLISVAVSVNKIGIVIPVNKDVPLVPPDKSCVIDE
jgi:hypothetical protein